MLTLHKLPDDLELWKEYCAAGLLWEEIAHGGWIESLYTGCVSKQLHNAEIVKRMRWTSHQYRIGILLED